MQTQNADEKGLTNTSRYFASGVDNLPFLKFPGHIHYLDTHHKSDKACVAIETHFGMVSAPQVKVVLCSDCIAIGECCRRVELSVNTEANQHTTGTINEENKHQNANKQYLGFDIEWKVSFRSGEVRKTALLQLAIGDRACYLFHLSVLGELPQNLVRILENPKLIKVGLNIWGDLLKLEKDYGVLTKGYIDVGELAKTKLSRQARWSLASLVERLLHKRLGKDQSIRLGDWECMPLPAKFQMYAATDAWSGLEVLHALEAVTSVPTADPAHAATTQPLPAHRCCVALLNPDQAATTNLLSILPPHQERVYGRHKLGWTPVAIGKSLQLTAGAVASFLTAVLATGRLYFPIGTPHSYSLSQFVSFFLVIDTWCICNIYIIAVYT